MSARARLVHFAEVHAGLVLSAGVIVSLLIISLLSGRFGQIGPDGDDVMRMVQVRDLLNGQGWFDLTQPRLGPEGGTLMHWSRLVDLPIAAIAHTLSPFIGQEAALRIACAVWPLISVLIVTSGLVAGARALGVPGVLFFTCLLGFAVLFRHFRFLPGAIDHHNLQLGLLVLAAGCLVGRERAPAPMALAGALLALTAAIGAEVHLFVVAIAAFVALDWAITGAPAQRGAAVFGASFAAVLTATFLITVPPLDYGIARCDAHASVTLLAGLAGGAAFALAVQVTSEKSMAMRFAALANVGAICAALVLVIGPQCLSNPLDSLSPQAHDLWLARVDEARPTLVYLRSGQLDEFLFRLGTPLAGLAAAGWLAWRRDEARAQLLFILLLTVCLVLSLYQTRFYVFGQLFAVLPLAVLAARAQAGALGPSVPRLTYLLVVLLAVPTMWSAAGAVLAPQARPAAARLSAAASCDPPATYAALASLPPGRILAPASEAPDILASTPHSALYGHYHRNRAGIDAALAIFTSAPDAARPRLAAAGVDYLLVCPGDADMRFFAAHAPDGLIGRILDGDTPSWLEPVATAGATTVYRVKPR
ncbi:MAG: hypothetical protein FP825_10085 [Hyphomonas sp.]|uniref:hypothetical protein n=1 Tax=Hyphomonas sp. TaxID=87 RepID=UPI0018097EAB|nr:hypothetical protein [Hyphomonas sp.]MBA3068818.1 hypothetical protein [Hyphomonas sp.]MBU3919385.1 hypothetical protein [Alphaproteobacteria bacterium]MBU4062971.1 hypothetical protein [Alphaproteobacteria bacterium]MBU4165503.1 hypothetical protein [Alphaproteobacteria bacterium]